MAKPDKTEKKAAKPDKESKPKKEKKTRPAFPGLATAKDGKLDAAVPEGWEWGKFKSLKKTNFTAEHLFLEHKAAELQAKAEVLLKKAEESKKLGTGKDRGKAKRLIKLQERMAELRASLESEGIDVEAMLASVGKDETEAEEA